MSEHRVRIWLSECQKWMWCCELCQPPAHGATDDWQKTMANVKRHCQRRAQHHACMARRRVRS